MLEDQMCAAAPDFDRAGAGFSPDRVDALVWAFADLLVEQVSNERYYEWARQKAASLQPKKPPSPEPVYAIGSMEHEEQQKRLAVMRNRHTGGRPEDQTITLADPESAEYRRGKAHEI